MDEIIWREDEANEAPTGETCDGCGAEIVVVEVVGTVVMRCGCGGLAAA